MNMVKSGLAPPIFQAQHSANSRILTFTRSCHQDGGFDFIHHFSQASDVRLLHLWVYACDAQNLIILLILFMLLFDHRASHYVLYLA